MSYLELSTKKHEKQKTKKITFTQMTERKKNNYTKAHC